MSVTVTFPTPAALMSLNDRDHWSARAAATKTWRFTSRIYAVQQVPWPRRREGPSVVSVTLPVHGKRRRDPHNFTPTIKAIVDGLVDADLWPDDCSDWVTTTEPRLEVGGEFVIVTITQRGLDVAA